MATLGKDKTKKGRIFQKNGRRSNAALYIMLIPFCLWMIIFQYRPMWGLQIAFKDYNLFQGMAGSPWVGLANFKEFMGGPYFLRLLGNTAIIGTMGIIFGFPAPIILAMLLNEVRHEKYKKLVQTVTYLPHFISAVIVCGIVTNLLAPSGIINVVLGKLFGMKSIYFLMKPRYFRWIYTFMNVWKSTGYSAVIYIAALSGVDVQLYEACSIDGGNKLHQMIHVTLPGILPTISIMLIMQCGTILSVGYETIILLYQPATYETADVLSTYVYRIGLGQGDYGIATAVGLFNAVVSLVLVSISNTVSKRVSNNSLW